MANDYNPFDVKNQQESTEQQHYGEQQSYGEEQSYMAQQPYQPQQTYAGQQIFDQPAYANGQMPGKGKATAALILGIVGVVFAFLSPIVGLVCSIIAVVLSGKARREGFIGGSAKAGKVLGIIGIVLSVIVFVAVVLVGVVIFTNPEVQQELQGVLNQ